MAIRSNAPIYACSATQPHVEHLWARCHDGVRATKHDSPGTWKWAHCLGVSEEES